MEIYPGANVLEGKHDNIEWDICLNSISPEFECSLDHSGVNGAIAKDFHDTGTLDPEKEIRS